VQEQLQNMRKMARELGLSVPLDFIQDVHRFGAALFFLEWVAIAGDKDYLLRLTRLVIPDKVRRRPLHGVVQYLLERWPKPAVREPLQEILNEMITNDDLNGKLDRYPPPIIWFYSKSEGKECSAEVPDSMGAWMKELYEFTLLAYHIRQVAHNPAKAKEITLDRKYRDQITRLSRKAETAAAFAGQRHQEAEAARQEKRELEGSLGTVFQEYEEKIQVLQRENELLRQMARPDPLAGKVICVVGAPGRIEGYRDALAERGAELRFVSGVDGQGEAGQAVAASDAVILDVGYAQHKTTMAARARADKLGLPVVMGPISGMGAFKESLGQMEDRCGRLKSRGGRDAKPRTVSEGYLQAIRNKCRSICRKANQCCHGCWLQNRRYRGGS